MTVREAFNRISRIYTHKGMAEEVTQLMATINPWLEDQERKDFARLWTEVMRSDWAQPDQDNFRAKLRILKHSIFGRDGTIPRPPDKDHDEIFKRLNTGRFQGWHGTLRAEFGDEFQVSIHIPTERYRDYSRTRCRKCGKMIEQTECYIHLYGFQDQWGEHHIECSKEIVQTMHTALIEEVRKAATFIEKFQEALANNDLWTVTDVKHKEDFVENDVGPIIVEAKKT